MRNLIFKFFGWLFKRQLQLQFISLHVRILEVLQAQISKDIHKAQREIEDKLFALQALEASSNSDVSSDSDVVSITDRHIVLMAQVDGLDYYQVIDIPSELSLDEWRYMVKAIQDKYGCRVGRVNVPSSVSKNF